MINRHILIIDDNTDDIELCIKELNKISTPDYNIDSLIKVDNTLNTIALKDYDCLMVDFHFCETSGGDILENIKNKYPTLPIVILLGRQQETDVVATIKSSTQDYLNKANLDAQMLHDAISKAIIKKKTHKAKNIRSSSTCKILIIDDNIDDIEFCIRSLKRKSKRYQCQSASSGQEGISLIKAFLPDCVILDQSLPDILGVDLLPQIFSITPHIPVIMMTGQGNEMIAVDAMKRGAENYLIKSNVDANLLDQNIKSAVQKKYLEYELFKKEQELISAYTFQDLVIESLLDYIFVKDKNFKLVKVNQAFVNLYEGKNKDEIIGFTTIEGYSKEEADAFLAKDREAFKTGFSETLETITFPNGKTRILFTQKKRFENAMGEPFILCVAKDVTEKESMIKDLQKSNYDLEQFAYIASHDLKSPLNAIKKLVSWIEEDYGNELPNDIKENFSLIKSRADRMSKLLTDLLEYSRISSNLSPFENIDFYDFCHNLHNLIENSETFQLTVPQVKVNLPRVGVQIVILNLISNTIKHSNTNKGNIDIQISPCKGGYNISITDDGPGIPSVYKHKVFEMFQTLKSRDTLEASGMGLAMVKKIIEYYEGSVSLDTDHTNGCRIKIFWPCNNNLFTKLKKVTP